MTFRPNNTAAIVAPIANCERSNLHQKNRMARLNILTRLFKQGEASLLTEYLARFPISITSEGDPGFLHQARIIEGLPESPPVHPVFRLCDAVHDVKELAQRFPGEPPTDWSRSSSTCSQFCGCSRGSCKRSSNVFRIAYLRSGSGVWSMNGRTRVRASSEAAP